MTNKPQSVDGLCCPGLFDADLVEGQIVLVCTKCGRSWRRDHDGVFVSLDGAQATGVHPISNKAPSKSIDGPAGRSEGGDVAP